MLSHGSQAKLHTGIYRSREATSLTLCYARMLHLMNSRHWNCSLGNSTDLPSILVTSIWWSLASFPANGPHGRPSQAIKKVLVMLDFKRQETITSVSSPVGHLASSACFSQCLDLHNKGYHLGRAPLVGPQVISFFFFVRALGVLSSYNFIVKRQ